MLQSQENSKGIFCGCCRVVVEDDIVGDIEKQPPKYFVFLRRKKLIRCRQVNRDGLVALSTLLVVLISMLIVGKWTNLQSSQIQKRAKWVDFPLDEYAIACQTAIHQLLEQSPHLNCLSCPEAFLLSNKSAESRHMYLQLIGTGERDLFNPNLQSLRNTTEYLSHEEALTCPGFKRVVSRFTNVDVSFLDFQTNQRQTLSFSGPQAICIQHSLDVLNGNWPCS